MNSKIEINSTPEWPGEFELAAMAAFAPAQSPSASRIHSSPTTVRPQQQIGWESQTSVAEAHEVAGTHPRTTPQPRTVNAPGR